MNTFILQTLLPFLISASVVILITVIAEKFGTKVGGILGTLPSTIIIAFIFIALNKNLVFASTAAIVVPAEMAINLFFLLIFSTLAYRSKSLALFGSLTIWAILSTILYLSQINNILISILIYIAALIVSFIFLEKVKKISSHQKVKVSYTFKKILLRGILAGTVIAVAVSLSNINATLSGIFSIFPAIFLSTMLITVLEHGPHFTSGMAKSMILGSQTVMTYVIAVHFLYPSQGLIFGTIYSFVISFFMALILLRIRNKIT
ncbi:MAG: DUF3147 family protein [Candidatus Thermoplasmatota archaeon]